MKWIRRNAKIIKPKAAEYFIPREELVQRLSRSDKKLTILCAPSGYGKTALMGLCAGSSEAPSAWYRLDGDDNVDTAFLETLTASLETAVPEFSWSPEEVRRRQGPETFWEEDDFYQRLGRELAYSLTKALNGRKLMLMLDDFQTLGARPVLLILSGLIGELPQGMRIFISTRGRIPEFTLRFLTAGKAMVLSCGDLAFSAEETARIFDGLAPDREEESLAARIGGFLEGWPAGTFLLYRYLKEKEGFLPDAPVEELCRWSGIYDLIDWEVIPGLPKELEGFLEKTSVLDRLSCGVCCAAAETENGRELLEEAFSLGLLIQDPGAAERSGHIPRVFRNRLTERMDEGERRRRCALAARYYLDAERGDLAAEYAVRARSGALFSEAAERERRSLLEAGDHDRMRKWIGLMDSMEAGKENITPGAFLTAALCRKAVGEDRRAFEALDQGMKRAEAAGRKNAYAELMIRKLEWMLEEGKGREALREAEKAAAGVPPFGKEELLLEYARLKCLIFCGALREARGLAGKLAEAGESYGDPAALKETGVRRKAEEVCRALSAGEKRQEIDAERVPAPAGCPEAWDILAARQILMGLERFLDTGRASEDEYGRELELAGILKKNSAGSFSALTAFIFTGLRNLGTADHKAALKDLDLVFRQARRLRMNPDIFPERIREMLYRLMLARERGYEGSEGEYSLFVVCFGSFRTLILETGEEVRWRSRKVRECMAFLALNGSRGFTREELLEALWDTDRLPANEVASFHNLLSSIRRSLAPWGLGDLLVYAGKKYSLKPGRVYTELSRGEDLVAAAMAKDAERIRSMQASLFRFASSPFLSRKGSAWALERRNFYEIWFARGLAYLGEEYRREGKPETAALAFQKAVELSPYMEQSQAGQLGNFAVRVPCVFGWEDLIVEEKARRQLLHICGQMKYRSIVGNQWGFFEKMPYGRGLSALFYGPPGTGKTMAVQVIAKDLGLDLYRVDLSRMVSKYIGETEKNISALFDKAKHMNVILFFDEADSFFSRRSEVKDANDRSANAEVAHLLQKLEEYEGITILATNLKDQIDDAFKRRIRFMVNFRFPSAETRRRLWHSLLPEAAPRSGDLDLDFFADQFELSGSQIKEILLNAAYMAAGMGEPLGNGQIKEALCINYEKYGKFLTKEDFGYLG